MAEEIEEIMYGETEVEFFEFIHLKKGVTSIKLSEDIFEENSIPSYSSLLAVSNQYGYFVAGTSKGFIYASTKDLREAIESSNTETAETFEQRICVDIPEGRVHFLRLTSDQLTIIVGIDGSQALYYDVTKISAKSTGIRPYQIMKFSNNIMDIRPNPGERDSIIAFLLVSGAVHIRDFILNKEICSIQKSKIGEQITAICWSQKGKQLVCGTQSGKLIQLTPEGNEKATYQAPPKIQQSAYCVRNILWLETTIFIVTYYPVVQDEDSEHVVYVILRESKSKTVYCKVPDICLLTPCEKSPYMFMEFLKEWGSELKNTVICACTKSSDINLIGRNESNKWSNWSPSETARANLPLNGSDGELLPIGMALDLSSREEWRLKLTGDEDSIIPPVPILLIYIDESKIVAYRCFQKKAYEDGKIYSGMTVSIPIPATGPSSIITTSPGITQTTLSSIASMGNNVSVPIISSRITNIPKNGFPSPNRGNLIGNNEITHVGSSVQNKPLKSQIKQASPTEPEVNNINKGRLPHEIRGEATEKGVQEIQHLIDDIENKFLIKYHEQTKTDSLENPNEWSIGDFPIIIMETKRLEKEINNITEYLSVLKQETTDLNLNFVKEDAMTRQEIELLVSIQEVAPRRGTIQSRITEKYEKSFKNVKEHADALEKQLDMLYEQIKNYKANKFAGRPPLEYVDRSIQNISRGLHNNASQIEQLNIQLDSITEQLSTISFNDRSDDFVSQQIEHETRKNTIPVKFSDETEEKTNQIMNKEWKLFKILNINKSKRKVPYETNLFSDIEPVQSHISPKIISPRKKSPVNIRGSTQIVIDKLKDSEIVRNKSGSPLRSSFSFDEESDYYNGLDTPIKKNTYTEVGLPINEVSEVIEETEMKKYNQKISELRERRLRYFENKSDDVNDGFNDDVDNVIDNVYSDKNPTYERLRLSRVRFQEHSDDDDINEVIEGSIQQKFEDIIDSDLISRIHLTNNDDNLDRITRLQIDPFENDFYEQSKLPNINNFSDYLSSPESPNAEEEGVPYKLSNEQKDSIISERSSTTQGSSEDSVDTKYNKILTAEVSRLSKVSEFHQHDDVISQFDILSSEAISAELEKKEEIIEPVKEEKIESTLLESEPGEIITESEVSEVSLTTGESTVTNESENLSFGLKEPSPFGETTSMTSIPSAPIPNAFNIGGGSVPAFATPSPNVNAFNQSQSQPTFGQPSFGQTPQIPNAFATSTFGQTGFMQTPSFGQTGFGQPRFGQVGLGQPTFGQVGFGQPTFGQTGLGQPVFGQSGFGTPSPLNTAALKTPSGGGFARFASSGSGIGFGSAPITATSTNKPSFTTPSNPAWSEIRK